MLAVSAAFARFLSDDFSPRLRGIEVDTRLVRGRHEGFCSAAEQAAIQALIGGARLVECAAAGHAMHWKEPQRFALDLTRFVTSVAASAVTT